MKDFAYYLYLSDEGYETESGNADTLDEASLRAVALSQHLNRPATVLENVGGESYALGFTEKDDDGIWRFIYDPSV